MSQCSIAELCSVLDVVPVPRFYLLTYLLTYFCSADRVDISTGHYGNVSSSWVGSMAAVLRRTPLPTEDGGGDAAAERADAGAATDSGAADDAQLRRTCLLMPSRATLLAPGTLSLGLLRRAVPAPPTAFANPRTALAVLCCTCCTCCTYCTHALLTALPRLTAPKGLMQRDTYDLFHDARPSFARARAGAGVEADAVALGAAGAAGAAAQPASVLLPLSHGKAMLARRRDGGACTLYVGSHNLSLNAWGRMFQIGLQAGAPTVTALARVGATMHSPGASPRRRSDCRLRCVRHAGGARERSSPSQSSSASCWRLLRPQRWTRSAVASPCASLMTATSARAPTRAAIRWPSAPPGGWPTAGM